MSTRISRISAPPPAVSIPGANQIDVDVTALNLLVNSELGETAGVRAMAAEIRTALTYTTIAQLAYDMGQAERGDQALYRALAGG